MFIKHTKCCVKVLVFSDSKLRACEAYNDKDNTQKMKHTTLRNLSSMVTACKLSQNPGNAKFAP